MRLLKLHVEGFGKLSGVACDLAAPVTIVYGPNEAGKSTLLHFLRAMLYGFANRGSRTERLEPVNGGRHGGRLYFADEAGRSFVMERYGASSGKVTVRRLAAGGAREEGAEQADTLTQPQWERLYLGGIGERVFRELFAITLTELQAIGMLEGDALGKQLYHAGWNGGSAIAGAEKLLQGQLDDLFKPRGSNQRMSKLLKALDETEEQLRKLEDGIAAFNELTHAIAETERGLADVETRMPGLRSRSALLERAAELRPAWMQRLALLQELDALQDAPRLAADARSRWESLANELLRAREELREAEASALLLESRLERLQLDRELLDRRADIDTLMLSDRQIAAAKQSMTELAAEQEEHREAVKRLLLRISPSWTEASLRAFLAGVAEREAVRAHRSSLQDAERALQAADAEHRAALGRVREAALAVEPSGLADAEDTGGTGRAGNRGSGEARTGGSLQGSAAAWGDDEALAAIFRLLPQTGDALRYAARQFEDAWRVLELALLRERHEAGEAAALPRRLGGAAAGYGAAAAVLAAGAAALAAAGQAAAAVAAGAAAAALAVPALLRLARPQSGDGRAARDGRARSRRWARSSPCPAARWRCCCRASAPPAALPQPRRCAKRRPRASRRCRPAAPLRQARRSCSRACAPRSTRGRTSSARRPAAPSGARSSCARMPGFARRSDPPAPRPTRRRKRMTRPRPRGATG